MGLPVKRLESLLSGSTIDWEIIGMAGPVANGRPSGSSRGGGFFAFHADRLQPTRL
jgi:hypothetical protein